MLSIYYIGSVYRLALARNATEKRARESQIIIKYFINTGIPMCKLYAEIFF